MAMTEARRNEIAYLFLLSQKRRNGIGNFKPNEVNRELGNVAEDIGISIEEVREFAHNFVTKLVEEAFASPKKQGKSLLGPAFKQ